MALKTEKTSKRKADYGEDIDFISIMGRILILLLCWVLFRLLWIFHSFISGN